MKKRKIGRIILWIFLLLLTAAALGGIIGMNMAEPARKNVLEKMAAAESETESEVPQLETMEHTIPKPEISSQLLTVNVAVKS